MTSAWVKPSVTSDPPWNSAKEHGAHTHTDTYTYTLTNTLTQLINMFVIT